jgi:uncharacterized protein YndB with AHSA1/START domain
MSRGIVAYASTTINAKRTDVWKALVDPAAIKQYMFGSTVTSDWKKGSPITWKGEFQGKHYEDKGVIQRIDPEQTLAYTHFSPLAGQPDKPENYHTVTIQLADDGAGTKVSLSQDNNATEDGGSTRAFGRKLEADARRAQEARRRRLTASPPNVTAEGTSFRRRRAGRWSAESPRPAGPSCP